MTPRQIAALAVRVLALYALFDSMKMISSVFSLVGFYSARSTLPTGSAGFVQAQAQGAFAQFFLLAGFALFLWFFADGLASFMVKDDAEATATERTSNSEFQVIAFSSVGVFAVLRGWVCQRQRRSGAAAM